MVHFIRDKYNDLNKTRLSAGLVYRNLVFALEEPPVNSNI